MARKMQHILQQQQLPLPAWIMQHVQSDAADKQNTPNPLELCYLLKQLLSDRTALPFLLLVSFVLGCMFLLLLQLSELLLGAAHLSPLEVGLCYLATGGVQHGRQSAGWVGSRPGRCSTTSSADSTLRVGLTGDPTIDPSRPAVGWLDRATGLDRACCSGHRPDRGLSRVLWFVIPVTWGLLSTCHNVQKHMLQLLDH